MPDIDIHQPHALGRQRAREVVAAAAGELCERFGLTDVAWDGDSVGFARGRLKGRLGITESDVHLQLWLGPALGWMRPFIAAEIRRKLRSYLG